VARILLRIEKKRDLVSQIKKYEILKNTIYDTSTFKPDLKNNMLL